MRLLFPLLTLSLPLLALAAVEDDGYTDGKAGWGAFVLPVPLAIQAQLDLAPGEGAVVVHVRPGGTADKLGLERGDVVLTLNDRAVSNRRDIRGVMGTVAPGDSAEVLSRRRDGSTTTLNGTFQERKPRPPGSGRPPWAGAGGRGGPGDWGGPPPEPEDPDALAARQYEELLTEQRQLIETTNQLAALRQAIPTPAKLLPTGNWYINENIQITP